MDKSQILSQAKDEMAETGTCKKNSPICTIKQGHLRGTQDLDIFDKPFLSFMGIPYAKPPVGNLRFQPPQEPEEWKGVRDATKHGNPCHALHLLPTPESLVLKAVGSEDCLFLNVYTHKLYNKNEELKPVMVFIHGGAFISGSSDRSMYGPEFLMTEDIVLVTINYRLGALGFLSFEDPSLGITGNFGLKDQVQALKWVQRNIHEFGGDPNNVTIFGESAGGASVHFLVLSPLAKGLFHKAIVQSASVLCTWTRGTQINAKDLAEMAGFKEEESSVLEFLQKLPMEKLLEAQVKLGEWLSPVKQRYFAPVVESNHEGAFLSEIPLQIIESGNYNHVPLMCGYTTLEGIFEEGNKLLGFQSNFESFVPFYLGFSSGSQKFKEINNKIIQYYFGSEVVDQSNKEALYLVLSDSVFIVGINDAVRAHSKTCQRPLYYYRMSIDTSLNVIKNLLNVNVKGVAHGDDLGYLFKMENSTVLPGSVEETVMLRFIKMWTNFAKVGRPIIMKDSLLDVDWKPVTDEELNFLDIGTDLVPGTDPDIERMRFWDELCEGVKNMF